MHTHHPPEQHHKITYALLRSGTVEFSATDWLHPGRRPIQGNTAALYVTGTGLDELRPVFQKLREGADPANLTELCPMPFGIYGRMIDRFGVEWFFRGAALSD
ncbi:glyoxalase/bleomycin resistance/extradiol dioxygenase family protein [Acidipila sp. EB88]|uniref:VOC family protein n=1 Tax=Acidipila sp. EB88 TaxID=2305226 RepID=UPI000F60352D|nr:hypothetical protein [Acidipila sp. EB88]RRA47140.1 hypothetical protein D1Y84_01380 [Acidipila sp. EB88]